MDWVSACAVLTQQVVKARRTCMPGKGNGAAGMFRHDRRDLLDCGQQACGIQVVGLSSTYADARGVKLGSSHRVAHMQAAAVASVLAKFAVEDAGHQGQGDVRPQPSGVPFEVVKLLLALARRRGGLPAEVALLRLAYKTGFGVVAYSQLRGQGLRPTHA